MPQVSLRSRAGNVIFEKLLQTSRQWQLNAATSKLDEKTRRNIQSAVARHIAKLPRVEAGAFTVQADQLDEQAVARAAKVVEQYGIALLDYRPFRDLAATLFEAVMPVAHAIDEFTNSSEPSLETPQGFFQKESGRFFHSATEMATAPKPVFNVRTKGLDHGMTDVFQVEKCIAIPSEFQESIRPFVEKVLAQSTPLAMQYRHSNLYYSNGNTKPRGLHVDVIGLPRPKQMTAKTFLYLDDVTLPHGPYRFVPGSHKADLEKRLNYLCNHYFRLFERAETDMQLFDSNLALNLTGPRGTFLISLQHGVHGGHPQEPGNKRYVLVENYS